MKTRYVASIIAVIVSFYILMGGFAFLSIYTKLKQRPQVIQGYLLEIQK